MHERVDHSGDSENLMTKINYDHKVKGLFGMVVFGIPALALRSYERSSAGVLLPNFMRGRLFDVLAVPWTASLTKFAIADHFVYNLGMGLGVLCMLEIFQSTEQPEGFDPVDFVAYTVGALGWAAFEGSAKAIHDSGLSQFIELWESNTENLDNKRFY